MLLFICHASEDQADSVRPLAEALRKEHDVWYSEYELTLGDSLLQKIDQGLASCDFGVVVLSRAFFAKKWPRAELDGLFALETQSRKIILPIWKGITEEEVKSYSPILAARLAVSTAEGLPRVLDEIRLAVTVSERQRDLAALDAATQRVQSLKTTIAHKLHVEALLRSEHGTKLVVANLNKLFEAVDSVLTAGQTPADPIQFTLSKKYPNTLYVNTIRGMHLALHATNVCSNSVASARLEMKIFRRHWDQFGQPTSDLIPLCDAEFKPSFRDGDQVIWIGPDSALRDAEQLAGFVVDLFVDRVHRAIDEAL
jgi:TIR domain-containing protein